MTPQDRKRVRLLLEDLHDDLGRKRLRLIGAVGLLEAEPEIHQWEEDRDLLRRFIKEFL